MKHFFLCCEYLYYYITKNKWKFYSAVYHFKYRVKIKEFSDEFSAEFINKDKHLNSCYKILDWLKQLPKEEQEYLSDLQIRASSIIRRVKNQKSI